MSILIGVYEAVLLPTSWSGVELLPRVSEFNVIWLKLGVWLYSDDFQITMK